MAPSLDPPGPLDFGAIFDAVPGPYLILQPDRAFTIVGVNEAYLRATMRSRQDLIGRGIFDAFPDNPHDLDASGVRNLRASLEYVVAHRQAHTMAVQKYDIPHPDGGFEERYWSPVNTPVLGADGGLAYVIHRVEDVTEFVRLQASAGELRGRTDLAEAEVVVRNRELAEANAALRRQVAERAAAEAALAREQDFLRAVLDNAADGIVACDADGVLQFFNGAARAFHGLPERPLPPDRWAEHYDLYLPDGRTRMTREQVPLFRALTEGAVRDVEMVIAAKGQAPRLVTANGRAIVAADGRTLGAVVVMHDLTARRAAEEQRERAARDEAARRTADAAARQLAESEERLRASFEQAAVGIAHVGLDGRWLRVNGKLCDIVGYPREELLGLTFQDITHPDDLGDDLAQVRRLVAGEARTYAVEKRYVRKDGGTVWVNLTVSLVGGLADPRSAYFVSVVEDISARRRAEEARRMVEFRFQRLVEHSPLSTQLFWPDGRTRQVNRAFTRLWGITPDELRDYNILADPRLVAAGGMPLMARAFAGEAVVIPPIPYAPDRGAYVGQTRWVGAQVYPVLDDAGRVEEVVLVHLDVTDQRRAEEERSALLARLEQQARLFDATLSSVKDVVFVFDADGRFAYANKALLDLWGRPAERAVGRSMRELDYPPDLEAALLRNIRRVYADGQAVRDEMAYTSPTGTTGYYEYILAPVAGPDGAVELVAGTGRDISVRMREQRELQAARDAAEAGLARWRAVVASMVEGVVVADAAGNLPEWNAAALEMHGYATLAEVRRHLNDFPEVLELTTAEGHIVPLADWPMSRVLRGEAFAGCELTVRRLDADVRRVIHYSGSPVRDRNGRVALGVLTLHDVTAARRAEAARAESDARLRLTTDALPVLVSYVDADERYRFNNAAYEAWFGVRPADLADRHLRDVVGDDVYRERRPQIRRALAGERVQFEQTMPHRSGGLRDTETSYVPDVAADGRTVRGFVALVYDITERRQAERERERLLASERAARSDAERASRMKDEFLATLSHELRTPLNAILGWAQILRANPGDAADVAEGLRIIERNARAQTQIIEDLLDMSRIVSGKVRLDVRRLDLAVVVREAVETIRPAAEAKGIRIQTVLDPDAGPAHGDPSRLQQVFWNLLSNAVKFTPKGGRVQVLLERVNSHLEVSVIDTGEGISPDFLPHVFDRFRQADATTTRRHGGLGLGLAIVKQLVELHGGGVRVKSGGPQSGSTFTVALPLTVLHPEPEPAPERRHPDAGPAPMFADLCVRIAGVRVLVVDDEPDARDLVRRLLDDCDAIVTTAASAAEALERLAAARFDVLVSDIGMPGEDGYALIRRVRALPPERGGRTPAVALTAYARAEDRMKAVLAGFDMHVTKPVEPAELITMVASLAGRAGDAIGPG